MELAHELGDRADEVLRDLAAQGNQVIFGTTFGYMETMLRLAREFPEVRWEHATGFKSGSNLRTYDVRTYQGAYLAGIIAGKVTHTDTLPVDVQRRVPDVSKINERLGWYSQVDLETGDSDLGVEAAKEDDDNN